MTAHSGSGFAAFFRRYSKTWLHGVSTAALTAFGALAILHRGFVALAIAAYVLPPVVLYAADRTPPDGRAGSASGGASRRPAEGSADAESTERSSEVEPIEGSSRADPPNVVPDADVDADADADENADARGPWTTVSSPTDAALYDVTIADGGGYAVGADGAVLADGDGEWRVALPDGPGAASETLHGVDANGDGGAVWVAGDGGTVARIDAGADRHVDYSTPRGLTDTWTDVAAAGPSGDEVVLLVNGSGEVLRGRYRGGELAWDDPAKPGGGSSLAGVAMADADVGYCCDTNDGVFETTDGGESFRRIGIGSADGTPTDVATDGRGDCAVSADDGVVLRRDGGRWTPLRLGDDAIEAIDLGDGVGVACGDRSVYERAAADGEWERTVTPAPGPLSSVAIGEDRTLAVGSDGAILERS